MKKILISVAAALSLSAAASAQEVSYALPQTSLTIEVDAIKETFYAGPYAKYARKYLGIDARQQDETSWQISAIRIKPYVEADQSRRHTFTIPKGKTADDFFKLTSQGLIATNDGRFANESVWRFTGKTGADFSGKGVSSNLTSEAATLYQNVRRDDSYTKVSVQQNMIVEKSSETKAAEAAEMIFRLRKVRVQIVTGDTDASYSGEAMASALAELDRLEKEYMSLFTGYSEAQSQSQQFDVVPQKEDPVSIAFRISDQDGAVSADNVTGKPYLMQIEAQEVSAQPVPDKVKDYIIYRIPAICTVRISDGANVLLQSRIPMYQYGADQYYPIR